MGKRLYDSEGNPLGKVLYNLDTLGTGPIAFDPQVYFGLPANNVSWVPIQREPIYLAGAGSMSYALRPNVECLLDYTVTNYAGALNAAPRAILVPVWHEWSDIGRITAPFSALDRQRVVAPLVYNTTDYVYFSTIVVLAANGRAVTRMQINADALGDMSSGAGLLLGFANSIQFANPGTTITINSFQLNRAE